MNNVIQANNTGNDYIFFTNMFAKKTPLYNADKSSYTVLFSRKKSCNKIPTSPEKDTFLKKLPPLFCYSNTTIDSTLDDGICWAMAMVNARSLLWTLEDPSMENIRSKQEVFLKKIFSLAEIPCFNYKNIRKMVLTGKINIPVNTDTGGLNIGSSFHIQPICDIKKDGYLYPTKTLQLYVNKQSFSMKIVKAI